VGQNWKDFIILAAYFDSFPIKLTLQRFRKISSCGSNSASGSKVAWLNENWNLSFYNDIVTQELVRCFETMLWIGGHVQKKFWQALIHTRGNVCSH